MKKIFLLTAALAALLTGCQRVSEPETPTLKSVLGQYFLVGVAMNTDQVSGADSLAQQVVLQNFNSVVAENCMKQEEIAEELGTSQQNIQQRLNRLERKLARRMGEKV